MAKAGEVILKLVIDDKSSKATLDKTEIKLKEVGRAGKSATNKVKAGFKEMGAEAKVATKKASGGFGGIKAGALAAVAGIYALYRGMSKLIDASNVQEKAMAKVTQGVKSTGGAAGHTAEELFGIASNLQKITTYGDEDILNNVTSQFLTFTNIAGKQFEGAQMAALNLATVLDGDLKSASIQLGKALNDPVSNLSALSRSGIQFSKEQKETIKSLWEAGEAAKAQDLILKELNKQYGGQAEALAKTNAGELKQFSNLLGDIAEKAGALILKGIMPLVGALKPLAEMLNNLGDVNFERLGVQLGIVASGLAAIKLTSLITSLGGLSTALPLLGNNIVSLVGKIKAFALALNSSLGPVGWVAIAIGSLVTVFKLYEDELGLAVHANKSFVKSFAELGNMRRDFMDEIIPDLKKKIPQFEASLKTVGAKLKEYYAEVEAGTRKATDEEIVELEKRYSHIKDNIEAVKKALKVKQGFKNEIENNLTQKELDELDKRKAYEFKTNRITLESYLTYLKSRQSALKESLGAESVAYMQYQDKVAELNAKASSMRGETMKADLDKAAENTRMEVQIVSDGEEAKLLKITETAEQKEADRRLRRDIEFAEDVQYTADKLQAVADVTNFIGESMQAERDRVAKDKKKKLDAEYKEKYKALANDLKLGKITKEEYRAKVKVFEKEEAAKTKQIEREQQKRSAIEKASAISNALIATYEAATKAFKALAGIPIIGPALGTAAAAAAIAFGLRNVKRIAAQGYAEGGKVTEPTLGLVGEAGQPEIIAPEKNFLQVMKEIWTAGAIQGNPSQNGLANVFYEKAISFIDNFKIGPEINTISAQGGLINSSSAITALNDKKESDEDTKSILQAILEAIENLTLSANIDSEELAIIVADGQALINGQRF